MKLNQAIAISAGEKSNCKSVLTEAYHLAQKVDLFDGLTRRYEPTNAESTDVAPEEKKMPQIGVENLTTRVGEALRNTINIIGHSR